MGVSGQCHAPAALYPRGKDPGTHCTWGWVGPRAGLDTEDRGKILCPCQGSNPDRPVVQPVVKHYTAWANPAPFRNESKQKFWYLILPRKWCSFRRKMSPHKVIQLLSYCDVARRKFISLAFYIFPLFSLDANVSDPWSDVTCSFWCICPPRLGSSVDTPSALLSVPLTATPLRWQNSLVQWTGNKTCSNLILTKRRHHRFLIQLHNTPKRTVPVNFKYKQL
jgi:hypothetical protein